MRFRNFGFTSTLTALAGVIVATGTVDAQLVVTEIWQHGSDTTTPDWFELTNFTNAAVDPSTLYYDDESADPTVNAQLVGITDLAPGESAVYLVSWHDDFPGTDFPPPFDPASALEAFQNFWGTSGAYQVGYILDPDTGGGPGLGGGGDVVNIFDGNAAGATLLDSKEYPDSSNEFPADNEGVTWVYNQSAGTMVHAELGVAGAFASALGNQVGSPGFAAPEPAAILLVLLGGSVLTLGRCRARSSS